MSANPKVTELIDELLALAAEDEIRCLAIAVVRSDGELVTVMTPAILEQRPHLIAATAMLAHDALTGEHVV